MGTFHQWCRHVEAPALWAMEYRWGFQPPVQPGPLTIGRLAHIGLAAHFRQVLAGRTRTPWPAMESAMNETAMQIALSGAPDKELHYLRQHYEKAKKLVADWLSHFQGEWKPLEVEAEYQHEGVIIHPDMIAVKTHHKGRELPMPLLTILDFKTTGKGRNPANYDMSGQLDLYAYVYSLVLLGKGGVDKVDLLQWEIMNDDGCQSYSRKPLWDYAERIFHCIQGMDATQTSWALEQPISVWSGDPWYEAYRLLQTEGQVVVRDYLERNFVKRKVEDAEAV